MTYSTLIVPQLPTCVTYPTRDEPTYPWHFRPSDHAPDGLFTYGPHEAQPHYPRWIVSRPTPVDVLPPHLARARTAMRWVHAKRRELRRRLLLRTLGLVS